MNKSLPTFELPAASLPNETTELPQVIRRDLPYSQDRKPRVVPWMGHKITRAVDAACAAIGIQQRYGSHVTDEIERRLRRERPSFVHIEQLQDQVEKTLLELGHAPVALAYAKYRGKRAALRELESRSAEVNRQLELVAKEQWDDMRERVSFARIGLDLSAGDHELMNLLLKNTGVELAPEERRETVILNARTLLEKDADSRFFAGRILLTFIYEETLPWSVRDGIEKLKEAHQKALSNFVPLGIQLQRLDPRLAEFDLQRLGEVMDPYADLQFDFLGIQTLYDRYLIHTREPGGKKRRLEAPQMFWMRVAMGLALFETEKEARTIEFYNIYKNRRACSSTPTLFNAGTQRPQLSSCYLLYCGDSLEEITETWSRFGMLSKWAGGLGCSWSAVRGAGAHIHGTNGESSGVIPFLKVSNDIALAVNQGGKRPGALCSYLELWHSDVEDFLDLRKETGDERRRTHNMNTALWIPDLFMKRLQAVADGQLSRETTWTLFHSSEVSDLLEFYGSAFENRYVEYEKMAEEGKIYGRTIRVLTLWKKMIHALFETGHPWMTWKDPANVRSPQDHAGVIHNSNLCTEIELNTSSDEVAVCNLASINISEHIRADGTIDHDRLESTVCTVMRMLDNVIDINFYPVEAARKANLRHRPVGLGVMGMQDALYMKEIAFDSQEAVEFNDEIMEAIACYAYAASCNLARERGVYSTFSGSKWSRGLMPLDTLELLEKERSRVVRVDRRSRMDWDGLRERIKAHGMRNSNCLAIAPTATISNIMGCNPCVEPTYKHIFTKSNLSGEFLRTNEHLLKALMNRGLWDQQMLADLKYFDGSVQSIDRVPDDIKRVFKIAFEIEPTWILQCAAVRQKWIDQAQSTNLWLGDNDARKASFTYREAWERGLKTTYYLRTLNQSHIDNAHRDREETVVGHQRDPGDLSLCRLDSAGLSEECERCQ